MTTVKKPTFPPGIDADSLPPEVSKYIFLLEEYADEQQQRCRCARLLFRLIVQGIQHDEFSTTEDKQSARDLLSVAGI